MTGSIYDNLFLAQEINGRLGRDQAGEEAQALPPAPQPQPAEPQCSWLKRAWGSLSGRPLRPCTLSDAQGS